MVVIDAHAHMFSRPDGLQEKELLDVCTTSFKD